MRTVPEPWIRLREPSSRVRQGAFQAFWTGDAFGAAWIAIVVFGRSLVENAWTVRASDTCAASGARPWTTLAACVDGSAEALTATINAIIAVTAARIILLITRVVLSFFMIATSSQRYPGSQITCGDCSAPDEL